jgi:hypothetical protein
MTKQIKNTFSDIQIIDTADTALFEVRLVVAMSDWDESEFGEGSALSPLEWLHNMMHLASEGHDVKMGMEAFMRSMVVVSERRIHLCSVEKVEA